MLTLAKGALLARFIGLASIPVLTRLYSPENFGVLALYTALVAILAPILTLRYVQAIPLPKTDTMAMNLFSLCLKLIFFGALIVTCLLMLFGSTLLGFFDMQALVAWWPMITLGMAGTALYELFSLWATRKKQYKILAGTQVFQSLMGNLTKIILGLLAFKSGGLLIGQVLAQSGGIGSFIRQSLLDFKGLKHKVEKKKIIFISKYYRQFPFYRLPSQFLMTLSVQAPVLMMAALYNKELTGQLSLAMLALSLPVNLIGNAASKAYYAEIAGLGKNEIGQIRKVTLDVQKRLFIVGLPCMMLTFFFAEPVFVLVFGDNWRIAGQFAAILAPFVLLQFTSSPLMQVLNVIGFQLQFLIINSIRVLGLLSFYLAADILKLGELSFVIFLTGFLTVFYLSMTLYILRVTKVSESI